MADNLQGCARPISKVDESNAELPDQQPEKIQMEVRKMTAKVGAKAPDFTGTAYQKGEFKTVTLSEYLGKWVVLCFYPGDFTFV